MNYKEIACKYETQFKEDLRQLIAIPSLKDTTTISEKAPFGKACRKALDKMMEIASSAGFKVMDYDGYACVIEYGEGSESVGVLGHLDIVPVGVNWTRDPFGCEEVDGYLFGRGTLDDKGPLVAALTALRILKDNNIKLNKKIMIICGCDEESGMECMKYYTKHGEIPTVSFTPDADFPVIYGEKGNCCVELKTLNDTPIVSMHAGERRNVVIGKAEALVKHFSEEKAKAFEFYLLSNQLSGSIEQVGSETKLLIEGSFAHAAMPWLGNNAGVHLLNFIGSAYENKTLLDIVRVIRDWRGSGAQIDIEGAYMGFLTMNTGIINVENEIEITLDIRYPNDTSVEKIKNGFSEALKDTSLVAEYPDSCLPLFLDPNSEFIQTLMNVYREYSNDTFTPAKTMGGGTYAKELPNCVAFGPEFPNPRPTNLVIGGPHQADEAIHIEDMMTAIAIYAAALEKLGQ